MVYLIGKIGKLSRSGFVVAVDNGDDKKPTRVWVAGESKGIEVGDRVLVKCTVSWRKEEGESFRLVFTLVEVKVKGGENA